MLQTRFSYPSVNGTHDISAVRWESGEPPRAILQIAHGMTEHIERYARFAAFLVEHGFVVCGNDHLAHGASVKDKSEWGVLEVGTGRRYLVDDVHALRTIMASRYEGVPYFILGHSMGSFVVRNYIARYGEGLAGAIVMGTGHMSLPLVRAGGFLARMRARISGPDAQSPLVHKMSLGPYIKPFEPARTPYDWLTRDEAAVDAYAADPRCTFTFSSGGYSELLGLLEGCVRREAFENTPQELPILVISGLDDPVGDFGKAPRLVADLYRQTGHAHVELALYEGDRHEVLGELDRDTVYADILAWLEAHV